MKNKRNLLIGAILVLLIISIAWAGTISQKPYGISTPLIYDYDSTTGSVGSYYLDIPTLTANDTFCGLTTAQTLTNKTLPSPTINTATITTPTTITYTVETVTATNVITATECGKTFILNSATEFVSTLPTPTAGCPFRFIVGAAPSSASYTVVTSGSANVIHGQIASAEDGAGSVSTTASADTITFVDSKAIVGDYVDIISDGTSWFVSGLCNVQDGITTTQAS